MTLHPPRVLPPVATGDGTVWVSGVTPGATVTIRRGDSELGQGVAAGPVVAVPVTGVNGPVHAVAQLGPDSRASGEVAPVRDPGEAGEFPGVTVLDVSYGDFTVPTHTTPEGIEGGFTAPLSGRMWLPTVTTGQVARPLVMIAHGYWVFPEEDLLSLQGYTWLAEHLARWGMAVCSVDLSTVNRESTPLMQQWSRGEVIIAMIDRLTADPQLSRYVDGGRVGLAGHSMGGEGVVMAQAINRTRSPRYGIRGVVSLAPTNYRPETAATHTAYLQLHGSLDYLFAYPSDVIGQPARFGGFRLYDRAWRPRSFAWIEGARHEGWNPYWQASPNSIELPPDPNLPELPADRQRQIGCALINAFFLDALSGRDAYRGYLSGPPIPRVAAGAVVHRQHQSASVVVVDDYGDAHDQFHLTAENPRDKTVNRRSEQVQVSGGVDRWLDVDLVTLPSNVHETYGLDFAWGDNSAGYESRLDKIAVTGSDVLSMRISQHYAESVTGDPDQRWNPVGEELDLVIELDDGSRRAAVKLSMVDPVPYPLPGYTVFSVFRTVRLPIDAFTAVNPRLDITGLRAVRLLASPRMTGRVHVDEIEFDAAVLTAPSMVKMLRVHDLGGGYGPADDHIDTEVIVHLAGRPGESFGLALRQDALLPAARGMLAGLRAALANRRPVRLAYRWAGPTVREIVRVVPE
jgi:hypothetical protein